MSARIRLVVSDVDGTIVNSDKSILPSTVKAVNRLHNAGIFLALISSRPPRGIVMVRDTLKVTGPNGAFNGGLIISDGVTIAKHLVPEPLVRLVLDFFEQHNIAAWLFTEDQWILKNPKGDYVLLERHTVGFDPTVVDNFAPYVACCGKVVGVSNNFELLDNCQPELNKLLANGAVAHKSQQYYLDVTHPDANKGVALQTIAAWYGVEIAEVAAIGDMTNDIPMFTVAGFSIAMGNAPLAVAATAKARTGSNTESGWADAIDRYIISGQEI